MSVAEKNVNLPATAETLIVGAGPTGLALGVGLVAAGQDVLIVDKQAEGTNTSRAAVVYPRTMELLEPYGVTGSLPATASNTTVHDPRPRQDPPWDSVRFSPYGVQLRAAGFASRYGERPAAAT